VIEAVFDTVEYSEEIGPRSGEIPRAADSDALIRAAPVTVIAVVNLLVEIRVPLFSLTWCSQGTLIRNYNS
jgi:hypothetical protein